MYKMCLISSTLIFMIAILPVTSQATVKIRLALVEAPPLMSQKLDGYGIEPLIVSEAFKTEGIDVEYDFYPHGRAFHYAKTGKVDGLVSWVYSDERSEFFYFSQPIFSAPLVFFHLKDFDFSWNNYDDLKGIPIGIELKNYYGQDFHNAMNDGRLTVFTNATEHISFNLLLKNRIKLLPVNIYSGYGIIRDKYPHEKAQLFTHNPKQIKQSVYHVLFSKGLKKNESLTRTFNKGLDTIKKNGTYKKICRKLDKILPDFPEKQE